MVEPPARAVEQCEEMHAVYGGVLQNLHCYWVPEFTAGSNECNTHTAQ
jgi:hypothetical protein